MAVYNVHAGHCPQGKGAYGAVGILKESVEDRIVKDEVIRLLWAEGRTVYDCTCEENTTKDGCLQKIVAKCNQHSVALDISIHLNSGRNDYKGDKSTGGTEVWNYDTRTKDISDRICRNIAQELGIRNRGTKYNKNLYVLANTNSPALLVECCFVDDKDDADHWNAKKCAKAIVEGILNKEIKEDISERKEESEMKCMFKVDGNATVYYFDGQRIVALTNSDQMKILQEIYKDNNGHDMPFYNWTHDAPWYMRLKQVIDLKPVNKLP